MLIIARLFLLLSLISFIQAGGSSVGEEPELVSYAQDLYRQQGINMPRSAFELTTQKDWGRIFFIRMLTHNSTLSEDLLQAFLIGGAVSQHAKTTVDQIVVVAEVEFSPREEMILRANGECCEKLYNNRMTPESFTEVCLRMK